MASLLSVHRLTKAQARRIAVRAQLLDAPRPIELLRVVERLTLLQIDPTGSIAPSADLVAWSRLGSSYRPADLKQALEQDRTLFELDAHGTTHVSGMSRELSGPDASSRSRMSRRKRSLSRSQARVRA